jgi:lipopolysaccharide/colanic/teichoic acid biosynthesis glycosyltransferase
MGDLSKRLIDAVASALLLVLLSPLGLVTPILVRIVMGSPVLFRQRRPGYLGRPFLLLKFRTMREATDRDGATLPDADRLSPLGRWLRRTSLDELPQLWNVLKGDMSLVGPRPLLMEYLPLYNRFEARRHEVRPGITGWAQVNGRNTATWPERFALDVYYVEHRSLWLDVRILLLTIWRVIRRDGISSAGEATMSKFTGSNG